MEVRAGYKQTDVGVIPEDWDSCALGEKAYVTKLAGFEYTLHFDYAKSGPIIAVRALNIKDGKLDLTDVHTIPYSTSKQLPRSQLSKGDLVMSYVGTLGRVAVIPEDDRFHLAPNVAKISADRCHFSPDFLMQFLNSFQGQKNIFDAAASTTQAALSMGNLRLLIIPKPPLNEQRAIATALSDVDALLGALDRLIAKKCDLKQAAMQQLLTGQIRLPGFSGKWEVKRLGELCTMKSGEGITARNIDEVSPFPCYGGNGLRGYTTRFTHEGTYCLIGRVGALCGNLLHATGRFFASEHAIVVTAFDDVDVGWLTLALGTLKLNRRAEASAQPVLTVSKLRSLELFVPATSAEQSAIAAVLSDMDAEIAALEARRAKTRELKQAMMQELLTGRTRLV